MFQDLHIGNMTIHLYTLFDTLAGITLLVFILLQTMKYNELIPKSKEKKRRKDLFLPFVQLFIISVACYLLFMLLNRSFAKWFTSNNANYFGNLVAWMIVLLLLPRLFKVSTLKTMDLLSPGLPLSLFVAKIACFCDGCCSGFEMSSSFYYNQVTKQYEFPVQMLEALVALMLFIYMLYYRKKNKVIGSVFPVYLILYSISRFITEFFRADLPNIIGPFDSYQALSIVYILIGILFLSNVRKSKLNN